MIFRQKTALLYSALSIAAFTSGCALFQKKPAKTAPHSIAAIDPAKKPLIALKKRML